MLERDFATLGAQCERIDLPAERIIDERGEERAAPTPPALIFRKRMPAEGDDAGGRLRVLLAIHTDTVFPEDSPFQTCRLEAGGQRLLGPGVADAKGGIVILWKALQTLEASDLADRIAWEVLLNPDEEQGSPVSTPLLKSRAANFDLALLYEPTLPDGAIIGERGGSGNFDIAIHGRAAHVGRAFQEGRSAVHLAADLLMQLLELNRVEGLTCNCGRVDGGGPPNVVADRAVLRLNLRAADEAAMQRGQSELERLVAQFDAREGYAVRLAGAFRSPPKRLDARGRALLGYVLDAAHAEGLQPAVRSSGGVCDGNKLHAAGLSNIDTLGARGAGIHSAAEYCETKSLVERARLSARLLLGLASGRYAWPPAPEDDRMHGRYGNPATQSEQNP